jgi:hypothetical protein
MFDSFIPDDPGIEMPGLGYAYFAKEVPLDDVQLKSSLIFIRTSTRIAKAMLRTGRTTPDHRTSNTGLGRNIRGRTI